MKKILLTSTMALIVASGVMGVAAAAPNEHANPRASEGGRGQGASKVTICHVAGNSGQVKSNSVSIHAASNSQADWSSCGGGGVSAATFAAGGLAETR